MKEDKEFINLKIKVSSENKEGRTLDINIGDEDWFLNCEPSEIFTDNINIEFYKENKKVGTLTGIYFKLSNTYNKPISIFNLFDSICQETYMVYEALFNQSEDYTEYIGLKSNVFYIERFYIEEEYRNLGLGRKIIRILDDILKTSMNCEVGCYILLPHPIESNGKSGYKEIENKEIEDKLKKGLVKFYKACGYEKMPKNNFMYWNTDYVL